MIFPFDDDTDEPGPGPRPFTKWTGGKRWLTARYAHLLPAFSGRLISPCLGGGAVELYLLPRPAVLADAEPLLVNAWVQVRDNPEGLIAELARLRAEARYTRQAFEEVRRQLDRGDALTRAARFILVLSWGFNGLWRTNRAGRCNTPFGAPSTPGGPPPVVGDPAAIREASRVLQQTVIVCQDFEETIDRAGRGDFVFADFPYDPLSTTASFTGYGVGGAWGKVPGKAGKVAAPDNQDRGAAALHRAAARGALVMATNHATPRVRQLYAGWSQTEVQVSRPGSCDGAGRGEGATELVIRSWR